MVDRIEPMLFCYMVGTTNIKKLYLMQTSNYSKINNRIINFKLF